MDCKQIGLLIVVLVLIGLLGCGPSPEAVATMTAEAWTPTPPPTATPTPIPYALTVKVVDAEGNPVPDASVVLAELGEDEMGTQTSDADGQVAWTDLPGENVSLSVQGQGYFAGEVSQAIERGPNEVTVSLEADPFGLLPSVACAPGPASRGPGTPPGSGPCSARSSSPWSTPPWTALSPMVTTAGRPSSW